MSCLSRTPIALVVGLFNGVRLLPDNLEDMEMFCGDLSRNEEDAISGNQCAQMCGVCVLITGTGGNQVYTVNQLATIEEHGSLGRGIALHLGGNETGADQPHAIRGSVTEARKDIQFTRVPCPVEGPLYLIVRSFGDDQNVSFTPCVRQKVSFPDKFMQCSLLLCLQVVDRQRRGWFRQVRREVDIDSV